MPNFTEPVPAADDLAERARGLAHATARVDRPGDTYWVLGSLLATHRRLEQVYVQLAAAHVTHQGEATTDAGDPAGGRRHAQEAAAALRRAVILMGQVGHQLDEASQQSGRIAWHDPAVSLTGVGLEARLETGAVGPNDAGLDRAELDGADLDGHGAPGAAHGLTA